MIGTGPGRGGVTVTRTCWIGNSREMICIRSSRVLRLGYILRTPPSSSIDVKESLVLIILIMSTYPGPGAAAVTVLFKFTRLREY